VSTQVLAVVTNDPHEVFQRSVIAGADDIATARGFVLRVIRVRVPVKAADFLHELGDAAGALVIANVLPDALLSAMLAAGIPTALISHRAEGLPIPAVAHDNVQGVALLMEHLVMECGRTQPLFVRGDPSQNDGVQRETAFRQEIMRYDLNLTEDRLLPGDFVPATAVSSLRGFLARGEPFDAVIAADYLMALAVLEVLRASEFKIPSDVTVVGFGDGPEAAAAGLTTVAADVVELGRRGARQLIGQLEGLTIQGLTLLSTNLVKRRTSC
jgi:LacI family transcriptional regulator